MAQTEEPKPPEFEYDVDHLEGWITSLEIARQKEGEWKTAADKIQAFIEDELRARSADTTTDAKGRRVIFGLVKKRRAIRITDFEQDQWQGDKFKENHPELVTQYTMKAPRKRFSILKR